MNAKEVNVIKTGSFELGGLGFFSTMFFIFLTLKLMGVLNWGWWWVTAPLWIPPATVLALVAFVLLFMGVKELVT